MNLSATLIENLNSVISVPIVPFRKGKLDLDTHLRNIDSLLKRNYLGEGRKRVICLGGTSLVDHLSHEDQFRMLSATSEHIGQRGIFVAGIPSNPLPEAEARVRRLAEANRPPDAYLIMPVNGMVNPDGLYQEMMAFGSRLGNEYGAQLLFYHRKPHERLAVARLLADSPWFIGTKIGTSTEDIPIIAKMLEGQNKLISWGIGDRSTCGARVGSHGHTSGINLLFARASDEIHEAQRRGDFEEAERIESLLYAFEEIRFREGRSYNYSAVLEAASIAGYDDIDASEGGPFNPPVSKEIRREIEAAIQPLLAYH